MELLGKANWWLPAPLARLLPAGTGASVPAGSGAPVDGIEPRPPIAKAFRPWPADRLAGLVARRRCS
jgi:hypothetical protein